MPSNSRQQYQTVEVKPEGSKSKSYRPSDGAPAPRKSAKVVHFEDADADADDDVVKVKTVTRDAVVVELWSMYYFERHATRCPKCYNPLEAYQRHGGLCHIGHGLAQDVDLHFFRQDGYVYSTQSDPRKLVRINWPENYVQTAQHLELREILQRKSKRGARKIFVHRQKPDMERQYSRGDDGNYQKERRESVVLEPAYSDDRRSSRRTTARSKPEGYRVVIDENVEASASQPAVPRERRGSLYYDDLKRQRTEKYRVEIREPEHYGSRRRRPVSGFWT